MFVQREPPRYRTHVRKYLLEWVCDPVTGRSSRPIDRGCLKVAFGQQSGPPASSRQLQELLTLIQGAGHSDFRDARGPMGFTQRQAGGRFTRDEADHYIQRLQNGESDEARTAGGESWREAAREQLLGHLPAEQLAGELRRRGWMVIEPLAP